VIAGEAAAWGRAGESESVGSALAFPGSAASGGEVAPADPRQAEATLAAGRPEIPGTTGQGAAWRLKARETGPPAVDDACYAIAVYGIPHRAAEGDAKSLEKELKREAALKRDGKKDVKPSKVEVLRREDDTVIVYLFPRAKEITRQDRRVEFEAQIGRFQLTQAFYPQDMTYNGKLEL
jgi:hypothetical protein